MSDERAPEEPVEDLDVPEEDAESVKGGNASAFLKLGDIKGESGDDKHKDSFHL
jgi:hypothetical protein